MVLISRVVNVLRGVFIKGSPQLSLVEKLYFVILSGVFVYLFLIFFQPFGINNYDPNEKITFLFLLQVLSMVVVGVLIMGLIEFLIWPKAIKLINNALMWMAIHLFVLSTGIFLYYNFLGGWHDYSWASYFEFIRIVSVLWLVPFIALFVYKQNITLRASLNEVHNFNYNIKDINQLVTFMSDSGNDQLTIPLNDLLYIENEDNYVAIYHISNTSITKTLLRKTLKKIEEEIQYPALVRCHRSFIINQQHLQKVHGNRNKLTLQLNHVTRQLPVSRQYVDRIYSMIVSS